MKMEISFGEAVYEYNRDLTRVNGGGFFVHLRSRPRLVPELCCAREKPEIPQAFLGHNFQVWNKFRNFCWKNPTLVATWSRPKVSMKEFRNFCSKNPNPGRDMVATLGRDLKCTKKVLLIGFTLFYISSMLFYVESNQMDVRSEQPIV